MAQGICGVVGIMSVKAFVPLDVCSFYSLTTALTRLHNKTNFVFIESMLLCTLINMKSELC